MKSLGLILKILAGLIVLVIVAVGVVLATVDPNDYREEITTAVKENTGRDFQVENMSLSIFPELAINLEKASLSNAEGFSQQPFFKAEKVQVGAAILPLLSKNLEVETLTLHGLTLSLEKNAEGKTNWDDLSEGKEKSESDDEKHDNENKGLEKLSSLNFGGIDIQNGQITWTDKQNQQNIALENVNIKTGSVTFGEFFNVNLQAQAEVSKPQIKSALEISLEAKLEKSGQYEVKNLVVNNTTSGQGIPVEQAKTTIELPSFTLGENSIALPSLVVNYSVKGGKDFVIDQTDGSLKISDLEGNIENQSFTAKSIQLNSDISGEVIPAGKTSINLSTAAKVNLKEQTAQLTNTVVKADNVTINASVDANKIIDNPTANAQIDIKETNLRQLLQTMKISLPKMADKNTLNKFALTTAVTFEKQSESLKLNNLKLKLDDSTLSGDISVKKFSAPAVAYNLKLDKVDVNRYLPPKSEAAPDTSSDKNEDTKIELPVEMLRKLNINGTFTADSVVYDKLKPNNIVVTTKANNGVINVNPIKADIFKTQVNAVAGLNVAGKTPKYSFKTNTKNLPIGEVLIAFTGKDQLTGTGTLDLDITTSGERVSEFKKTLNGNVYADLTDGAVKGFNLAQSIREAKAKLSGKTLKATDAQEQTDFSELTAKASIKNGVVTTQTLSAKAPFMRINGSGTVNLPKESLNYLVKTKIVGSDEGQGGAELKELNGLTIPVKLKGNYMSPDVSLDLGSLVEQKTKAKIEEKKEEVVKDIKKKAEEQLKDSLFKGLKF